MLKFSLIIPVYNIEDKISKCLDSILNQSFVDFEALIIIDGSTDCSEAICKKYAEKDNRLKIFEKENGGLVSARKYGSRVAQGDYIINIDGDDYIDSGYLYEVNKIITEYNPDMIAFGYNEISNYQKNFFNKLPQGIYRDNDLECIVKSLIYDKRFRGFCGGALIATIWTKVVRAEIYKTYQNLIPDNISVGEDLLLNSHLLGHINSLYISEKCFYNYVVYDSSMMHKYNIENAKHYLDVAYELRKIDYIDGNDVNVYLLDAIISELLKIVRSSDNYLDFKEIVLNNCDINQMMFFAKKAKIKKTNIETLIKTVLIHLNSYRLVYVILNLL